MSILGATRRLDANNVDADGNPADLPASAVPALSVTLPDLTAATPAVSTDGVGLWHADLVTTQAGRHVARWSGAGFAWVEAFSVDPSDVGMLLSLDEARRAVGRSSRARANARDDELMGYVAAVTPIIEDIVGPILPRVCDEVHDGGGGAVMLRETPVLSVTSVTESGGSTPQDVTAAGWSVDLASGLLDRRNGTSLTCWAGGIRNIHVVYTAGRAACPPNVLLAAKEELRFLWQTGRGAAHPGAGDEQTEVEYTPAGYAVPRRVIELCAGEIRGPGIA